MGRFIKERFNRIVKEDRIKIIKNKIKEKIKIISFDINS